MLKKFKFDPLLTFAAFITIVTLAILSVSLHRIHTTQYRSGLESGCMQTGQTYLECRKLVRMYDRGELKAYVAEQEWTLAQLEAQLAYLKSDEGAKNPNGWVRPAPPDFVKMTKPWWKFWG